MDKLHKKVELSKRVVLDGSPAVLLRSSNTPGIVTLHQGERRMVICCSDVADLVAGLHEIFAENI